MARYGQKLASSQKLSPAILPYYLLKQLNDYDTRTLAPLSPRYVSSVDSGNMAGHLLTLREGLSAMRTQPILDSAQMLAGLDGRKRCGSD